MNVSACDHDDGTDPWIANVSDKRTMRCTRHDVSDPKFIATKRDDGL